MDIRRMTADEARQQWEIDDRFVIDRVLELSLHENRFTYIVKAVPPTVKRYDDEDVDYSAYVGQPDCAVYLAWEQERVVGRLALKRNWNGFALIEDIAVDLHHRGRGIGKALLEQARSWARQGGMAGVMLETQHNNGNACLFYARSGFELGGCDMMLYRGLDAANEEIALFWYDRWA